MKNPYSNERAEARKKARQEGLQTTQTNWDNYALGKKEESQQRQTQGPQNYGEITKIVNDAIASSKQSIINEAVQSVLTALKTDKQEKQKETTTENKTQKQTFEPTKAPLFNYQIAAPSTNGEPFSSIIAEIPFAPDELHVLGLLGNSLLWVPTAGCNEA